MTTLTILPSDAFVSAAFDELLTDVTNLLTAAQASKPLDRDEVTFWRRQYRAFVKAQYQWSIGVRPISADQAWLIPSASQPGSLIHRATQHGGIWVCDCDGRHGFHWHMALIHAIERGAELEALAEDEAAERLSKKISETRARYMAAA